MWQNNAFGNNGQYHNKFNQEDYSPPAFSTNGGPVPGQQYFPQHQQQANNMIHFEDGSGEGYTNNDFQPELGFYNEGAFLQNQFTPATQFSPPFFNMPLPITPTPPRPATQINARAAELKAQLLKGREGRASPSTPPVGIPGLAPKQTAPADGSSSSRGSPKTPLIASGHHDQELNDLISQYSETKPAAESRVKQEKNNSDPNVSTNLQRIPKLPDPPAKSQAPSLGSPTKDLKPVGNGKHVVNNTTPKSLQSRPTSNGSISEGEILEEPTIQKLLPATDPKKGTQAELKQVNNDEQASRKVRSDDNKKPSFSRKSREDSSPRRAVQDIPKSQNSRPRDERREDADSHTDRRPHQPDYKIERKAYPGLESRSLPRRDHRDQDEEYRRAEETKNGKKREEVSRPNAPAREQSPPTLAQLLPYDEDLKEWLEITGYHNAAYRDKILNRYRAIAALDAQRERLLAEMEAEERGTVSAGNYTPKSAMLPPPIPNKVGSRADPAPKPDSGMAETQRDRVVSNKRPYSDFQDSRDEGNSGKVARTDDRSNGMRIKEEEALEHRHPRSSGHDYSRRSASDHRDEREPRFRFDDSRGRGRDSSRERETSPGRRSYEGRLPPWRTYEPAADDYHDRDEQQDRTPRPHEVHGSYRGRAYDPNYRGRGRGRGRGDFQGHLDQKPETNFGSKIASMKPWKDPRGFDRGGKGDTRYFIVKSFNEDNVLKCMQESVWTTQAQNGPIFKEAFETCKNVILVFSINRSRAFQGYARLESLPGSVDVPGWQRAINWESAGAFRVRWLVICSTRFHRIGHLKNALNENQAVLIGKDGQEIEENCGAGLIELIDEEAHNALANGHRYPDESFPWED